MRSLHQIGPQRFLYAFLQSANETSNFFIFSAIGMEATKCMHDSGWRQN